VSHPHYYCCLGEPVTVSNCERLKPPYVGVMADSVIRLFFLFCTDTDTDTDNDNDNDI